MNWTRTLLDGAVMAAVFNLSAIVIMFTNPRYMMACYPAAIRNAVTQPQTKREKTIYLWSMCAILLPLLAYGAASAATAGITGFWPLFWTGYVEWLMASLVDFFLLDMILFQTCKSRMIVPGTEGHPGYGFKQWVCKLALPEHLLLWPLVMAPLCAAAQAELSLLMR